MDAMSKRVATQIEQSIKSDVLAVQLEQERVGDKRRVDSLMKGYEKEVAHLRSLIGQLEDRVVEAEKRAVESENVQLRLKHALSEKETDVGQLKTKVKVTEDEFRNVRLRSSVGMKRESWARLSWFRRQRQIANLIRSLRVSRRRSKIEMTIAVGTATASSS